MRRVKAINKKQQGFTLFELVVTICVIVFLYMIAAQRLSQLPAAAERASYYGVLSQISSAIDLEIFSALTSGSKGSLVAKEGTNPMLLMISTPSSYRGELDRVTDRVVRRGNWYFETETSELVYVVGERSIEDVFVTLAGIPVNFGQIRFRLIGIYDEERRGGATGDRGRLQGLRLEPVNHYTWERRSDQPIMLEEFTMPR